VRALAYRTIEIRCCDILFCARLIRFLCDQSAWASEGCPKHSFGGRPEDLVVREICEDLRCRIFRGRRTPLMSLRAMDTAPDRGGVELGLPYVAKYMLFSLRWLRAPDGSALAAMVSVAEAAG
jgi:hypothetical protein